MRGSPNANTATEAQIGANSAADKLGWVVDQFHRTWARALEIYAWYLAWNDKVVVELTVNDQPYSVPSSGVNGKVARFEIGAGAVE